MFQPVVSIGLLVQEGINYDIYHDAGMQEADMTYQALKYYCNEGLVPQCKKADKK